MDLAAEREKVLADLQVVTRQLTDLTVMKYRLEGALATLNAALQAEPPPPKRQTKRAPKGEPVPAVVEQEP